MAELPGSFVAGPRRPKPSIGRQRDRKRRRERDGCSAGGDSRGPRRRQGDHWRVGDAVEVLWHGKPYDGTVRALNDADEQALVAYDPPFDRYPPEWRYFRELRPAPELPPGYVGLERRLAGLLTRPQQRRVDLTYLTKDHSSWVLHVPGWHPVGAEDFEAMWALHPPSLGRNSFQGRSVATPRYFQAFGRSYSFSGQVAEALPLSRVPLAETARQRIKALLLELGPCSDEAAGVRPVAKLSDGETDRDRDRDRGSLPPAPNGVLVNWYLASHYIGLHRDDTRELVPFAPVWSISWGHSRLFCLRPRCDDKPARGGRCSAISAVGSARHVAEFDASGNRGLEIELGHGDLLIMGGRCQSTHKHEVPKLAREALRELELQAEGQSDEYRASTLEAEPDGRAAAGAPLSASPAVGFLGRRINLTLRSFS